MRSADARPPGAGGRRGPTKRRVEQFWAERLHCAESLFQQPGLHLLPHPSPEAAFLVGMGPSVVAAVPGPLHGRFASIASPHALLEPRTLEPLLPHPAAFVGPAYVGYAESASPPSSALAAVSSVEAAEIRPLRAAATRTEWQHANLDAAEPPLSAVLAEGSAICAAGFERLLGRVASIGVLTHPAYRGRRHARQVVAAVASRALAAGLLPQYQTLLSNGPALAVGRAAGFTQLATTLACRWQRGPA